MQRKFKVVDPQKDINIAKWVSVSSTSQYSSPAGSPRITLTSRLTENTIVISPRCDLPIELNTTPKSIKVLRSPVFLKDTTDVIRTNKRRKQKSNTKKISSIQPSAVNLDDQIVTPKVIYSPGIIRDTKDWRLDTTRSSKHNLNSTGITQRSFLSGSCDLLDSSRTLFKPEVRQNVNVNNWVTVVNDTKAVSEDDYRIPPSFSARTEEEDNFQTENMSETVLQPRKQSVMSNKVGESRKEIEKLKNELETLISTNLKNKNIIPQPTADSNIENVPTTVSLNLTSPDKQNVIVSPPKTSKSPSSVRRKSTLIISETNLNIEEPKSKARNYDPESTREFIKRQKLRRKEKLHQEEIKKKESEEFKKQKLEDLKQKTSQLLSENVKKSGNKKICAKRSDENLASKSNAQLVNNKSSLHLHPTRQTRARSFDRQAAKQFKVDVQENVDKTKEKPWQRSRSVSREPKVCDKKSPVKPRKSLHESKPNSINTISNAQAELDQVVNKISHLLKNDLDENRDEAATKIQAAFRGYQERSKSNQNSEPVENIPVKSKNTPLNTNNIHSENHIANEIKSNIPSEIIIEKNINIPPDANDVLPKNVIPSKISSLEEIIKNIPEEIIKSANQSQKQKQKDLIKYNGICQSKDIFPINEDSLKEIEIIKQKLETSISQSNLENKRNETPAWLLPPSTLPYPYNFISAVRKKLEIATKSHTNVAKDIKLQSPNSDKFTKDTSIQTLIDKRKSNVSIQCSLENSREIKDLSTSEIVPPKPEELRTFISHKCRKQLVYDSPPKLQSPTNIKDINKETKKKKESVRSKSRTLVTTDASDSDTTKNIPEISEEEQFSKHYSDNLDMPENFKNITFNRANAEITTSGKNFTFDQIKVDKNSSHHESKKLSIISENSDRLKNISFDRRTNNSSLDISDLIKPDYKIDTSKISKHSIEHHSNRSKYPSDIDSILTQYSKMKSSSKSNIHNESQNSQYSEDFNSSSTNHLSLPHTKSNNDHIQNEKGSSLDIKTESRKHISKAGSSDLSKIKSEILASLARQHSSSLSNIPKQISESLSSRISGIVINDSTDINIESLNKISSGSHIGSRNSKNTSESRTRNSGELNSKNTSNNVEPLSKNSSKVTEIKTKNSNNSIKENNSKDSEIKSSNNLESLDKYFLKMNSEIKDSKTDNSSNTKHTSKTKSDVSEIKSKNSFESKTNESQIKTNPSNSISHSKKEASIIASSIPEESVVLKTDSQSAQESNIIKSSIDESLKQSTESVKTDTEIQSTNEKIENTESKSVLKSSSSIQNLSKPIVNLKIEKEKFFRETKNNPNQIHLKFQAEVHLLNSFNNSLQQVVAVEKSLLDIREPPASSVNFTRGCGAPDQMESLSVLEPSVCSQDLAMSRMSDSVASEPGAVTEQSVLSETCSSLISRRESAVTKNPYVGVSLGMFDQMIRDEDNRLEHLKAILKLRDKALFDRTKGELAWLEIQKKQLRENGQLNDVTIIKKKQRGLIIKLEQERHEMQRLKQAHKQAAKERKNALREQKNIIKQQLSSTDQIPTKIRRLSHLERRQSGPVKVYRVESRTEHVKETTMSKNSSGTDETISVTTSSVVTQISEKVSVDHSSRPEATMALKPYPNASLVAKEKVKSPDKHSEKVKRALLMKEADLEKRRKEAEELLKWHERLKQEEAQVVELERQAKSIQLDDHEKKRVLTGAQLNKIWKGITGSVEKKFDDHKKYQMSKRSLDKFYQNARKIFKEISEERNSSKRASEESYTSDFDPSHSPSKINLSSSLMTQINETDLSISPNKMLSDRLRKISESSRIEFITSIKSDTDVSEQSTVSEETQLSTDKKSVLSEILSVDQQNITDSNVQTAKDSSIHSAVDKSSSKTSVISESLASKKSIPSEIKSRKSSIESDFPELQITSDHEQNKLSDTKESTQSVEEQVKNSSTDSDLPELQIVSELDQNTEIKSSQNEELIPSEEAKSKNSSTDTDLPGLEIDSELETHSEHIKSADMIESIAEKSSKFSKNSESQIKSEYGQISEKSIPDDIEESVQSIDENKSVVTSDNSQYQNISEKDTHKSETLVTISNEIEQKSPRMLHDSQISVIESVIIEDEPNNTDSNQIITEPDGIKSKLSSDLLQLDTKTEDISVISTENKHSDLTPKDDTNISVSFKEIISAESEQQIASKISVKTIKSEENTSKIIDECSLLPSDSHVPSDIELKSEVYTSSQISSKEEIAEEKSQQNSVISDLEESISAKTSDIQDSSTIQSYTLVQDNISDNKRTSEILSENKLSVNSTENEQDSKISEYSNQHSDIIKSTVISDQISLKLSIQSEIESDSNIISDLLIENIAIQSPEIFNKSSENRDTNIASVSEVEKTTNGSEIESSIQDIKLSNSKKSAKFVSQSQDTNIISSESDKDLIDSDIKSKLEEPEITKSSSLYEDPNSKSGEIESKNVESIIESAEMSPGTFVETKSNTETEEHIYEAQESESDKISEVLNIVQQTKESNIQSEVSTPHESEPYYQTDFERISETDFTSETDEQTKELNEESEIDKDVSDSEAKENTESIKSSISIETEKESVTKIESTKSGQIDNYSNSDTKDQSETFESEKESGTIIESPKSIHISIKENDLLEIISSVEENSEIPVSPSSESQVITNLSQKSMSTEGEESIDDNKDSSEHSIGLQNEEDTNIVGVSHIDVRKRVSEILADTTVSRGDKSPRLQDLYVTTYDVMTNSPESTPETGSPTNECNKRDKASFTVGAPYRTEAEELLRKQLEIEQEIKQLERQQQNLPYLFMREIPNKPPPPYKPPNAPLTPVINSVIPVHAEQIRRFVKQSAEVLFEAYVTGNLKEVSYKCNEDDKVNSQKYVFDLCKEIALEVCKPMETVRVPSWKTQKNKFQTLISRRPLNKEGLCSVMSRKVLQLLNFEPVVRKDNLIIRWSRKKRDHVDEILVLESQTEETEWTNYDSDEQTIKDNLTSDIMNMLILETAQVMCEILKKKKKLLWTNYC